MALIELISPQNLDAFIELIPPVLRDQSVSEEGFLFYGISESRAAVGVVIIKESADVADLRYLYILPQLRGSGIMDGMLAELFIRLRDDGYNYLTMYYIPDEYQSLRYLSERFGFEERVLDYGYFRFTAQDLKKSKVSSIMSNGILRFKYLPKEKKDVLDKLIKKYIAVREIDVSSSKGMEPYSLAYMENEQPKGALIVEVPDEEGPALDFLKHFPEVGAYDITLFLVGTGGQKAPLYLLSGFCQMVNKELPENTVITGYFPEGHVAKLVEGALGIMGHREVCATLDLRII